MKKIRNSELHDQTEEFDEDKKLISEDQLYPNKRVKTPVPDTRNELPSAVELENKGRFDVIDIIEESQNNLSNQVLIDQTGMSPYDSREENSRMQSAEPYRDTKLQMKKVKLAKSTDQSEHYDNISQINISSKEVMLPGEQMSTTPDQQFFMKPGLAKSKEDKKVMLQKPERQSDLQGSEQINFQTSEAAFNDIPVRSKRRVRKEESTDSDEMESIVNEFTRASVQIKDQVLKVATNELSEPKIQLSPFFDEDGVQKSMCRDIIQHPEKNQYYASSGEFGNQLRLFDVKNIEKGNHKFETMMRRVNICPTDLQNEQAKVRRNLAEVYSFFRTVYDAHEDQCPEVLKIFNDSKCKMDQYDPKKPNADINEVNRQFKKAKNQMKEIYINSFCLLGDDDGHVIVGLNKLQKAVLLKPTSDGPYQKVDEINFNKQSLAQKMNIMQVGAATDCYEVTHRTKSRSQFDKLLQQKKDDLDQMNISQSQKLSEMKKTRFDLKRKFQERYYKVFVLHKCQVFQTVKLTYHLVALDTDSDENNGELFFLKESKYADIYKYQSEEKQVNQQTNRKVKNEVNLRTGTSHFMINDESESDSSKQELIICVKQIGKLFKPCFEIRRFEDLSIKRHIKADFSASSFLRDYNDVYCLTMTNENDVLVVTANFEQLSQIESDRMFTADKSCFIKDADACFDGIEASQIINAGPYLVVACMQKLTIIEKKLNHIVMQAETMGRIKSMTLSRDSHQLYIQTEDNYLYCILVESISQICYKEEEQSDLVPYYQISKVIPTFHNAQRNNHLVQGSNIQNLFIAKGRQLWLQEKSKLYQKCASIAYFPNHIQDVAMDKEGGRIFLLDDEQQLYVYILETNQIRFMMEFEHKARMELVYMPKILPFNRARSMRLRQGFNLMEEEDIVKHEVHLLIHEGEDDDISFYKLHVPDVSVLKDLDQEVKYGIYDSNALRYWGPIKQPDIFKVVKVCYFDKTIFVLFQSQERDTKFIRRFDDNFDRQEEVMSDFRLVSKQIDDYQLEDEAFLTQVDQYLIISYRNKTEYIIEDKKQRRQIHVYRTVDNDYLEKGFVVLSFFEGSVVASISEEGHYVVLRDIDQNEIMHKQELNFIPQQILIDEDHHRFFVKECFQKKFEFIRFSQEFRKKFVNSAKSQSKRLSINEDPNEKVQIGEGVQDVTGLGRLYEYNLGVLLSKKNKDRQYNSLKKEMLRYQLHCATDEERQAYLQQENQFYTMLKMTANFVTISCCMGLKDKQMKQAINMGVPVINDISGNSPIHFARLTNNLVSLNTLVMYYQSQPHYTHITMQDRDLLISAYQSNWKQMFCFGNPIYFKEAQKLIANGFHGNIRPNKEIIYTEDSEISKSDIVHSITIYEDENHDQEFTDAETIEGQTLRVQLNMQIQTDTCYRFLKLLYSASDDLLEQSDLHIIIQHSYNINYSMIFSASMIHIVQAIIVLFKVTTESAFCQVFQAILAIFIIVQQFYLISQDEVAVQESKMRIASIVGNILVIVNTAAFSTIVKDYEWNNQTAVQNYFNCIMIFLIFMKGIHSLTIFSQLRILIEITTTCLANLVHFLILLFIYVLMFASMAFVTDSYAFEEKQFFENIGERYKQVFGESLYIEFFYDSEGALGWIIYLLFSLIVHVVMLNLLIHLVFDSYQKVQVNQKSINTRALIHMLLEVGIFLKILKNKYLNKSASQNDEQDKLYYVHRFVTVSQSQTEDPSDQTWQSKIASISSKQNDIYERQVDIVDLSKNMHKNIESKIDSFSGIIEKQTVDIFKRLESQHSKTFSLIHKQISYKSDQALGTFVAEAPQQQVGVDQGRLIEQLKQMKSDITSQLESKHSTILSELIKQEQQINSQNDSISMLQQSFERNKQAKQEGAPENSEPAADQKPSAKMDESVYQEMKEEITNLKEMVKSEQQNSQSQMLDVKNQIEQVVRKMSFLENAINDMNEAREQLANNQERLKDDIQNMLFDQKHQIIGSISQVLNNSKTQTSTQIDQLDFGTTNVDEEGNEEDQKEEDQKQDDKKEEDKKEEDKKEEDEK